MLKLTRKNLYEIGGRVYRVSYCGAENLFRGCYPIGKNSGVYGWNWDAYILAPDVVICTGYRSLVGIDANKITAAYEKRAERVINNYDLSYNVRMNKITNIRKEWIDALRDM